ncbi:site-specific integrase [Vibrio parahaemolyticus]|nr:site-specific integrase [Vibrio parahaemolyticus]
MASKKECKRKGGKQGAAPIPSREQIISFLDMCGDHRHSLRNRAIMVTFFVLGLRPMECASLKLSDVYDFDRDKLMDELFLKKEYTKRGKPRVLELSNDLLIECWTDYIDERKSKNLRFRPDQPFFMSQVGGHFSANSIGNLMNDFLEKRFGFNRGCSYSGRRYFATSMHENGVSIKTIQELMGHTNPSTTHRYIVATKKQKISAIKGVL